MEIKFILIVVVVIIAACCFVRICHKHLTKEDVKTYVITQTMQTEEIDNQEDYRGVLILRELSFIQ